VAVAAPLPGRAAEMLTERFDVRVHHGPQLVEPARLAEFIGAAHGAVTLLANPVTADVLEACRSLRVVGNVAVGFDNVDLAAAERRGIRITNTPDVLTEATADLTWALILAVTRRLVEADGFVRQGRFEGWSLDLMLGTGLQRRTLGIVGYGRIGRAVARRAQPFGMNVVYNDQRELDGPDPPARFLQIDELLATAHVVSLHMPLTDETYHLMNESRLRAMLPRAVLINTARGPLVDEEALVRVLAGRHLAGAGLDVYEHEPAVHPGLIEHPHVVLLPHVGSATVETRAAMAELAAANVIAVLEGREPPTPVVRGHL
jgi:glyoxylate reductase